MSHWVTSFAGGSGVPSSMPACHPKEQESRKSWPWSHGWIIPIERPVHGCHLRYFETYREEVLVFPWLLEGLVQTGNGERLKVYFITFFPWEFFKNSFLV